MKNLIHLIDKLDELPIDTLWYRLQGEHMRNMKPYNSWERYYHAGYRGRVEGVEYYPYIKRFLNAHIGQPFDDVFSKFCKKVPKLWQREFQKFFEEHRFYRYRSRNWYVDDDGLIQYWQKEYPKQAITLPSLDYETALFHKTTGKRKEGPFQYYWERDRYEKRIISGEIITFESKKERAFKRLYAEREKLSRKISRESEKQKQIETTNILKVAQLQRDLREAKRLEQEGLKAEEIKRKEAELNKLTIERLGFDPVTSFRNTYGRSYRKDSRTD